MAAGVRADVFAVTQFLLLTVTFVTTYFVSTSLDHVPQIFPYISDTGNNSPERCIFSILLAVYSLLTLICVYCRWKIVVNQTICTRVTSRINNAGLFFGVAAAVGVLIVGSFQEGSVLIVHLIGAGMAFFLGVVYMWLHSVLSHRLPAIKGSSTCLVFLRWNLTILATASGISFPVLAGIFEFYKDDPLQDVKMSDFRLSAASIEWGLAGLVTIYFLTFVAEFRHVRIGMPVIHTSKASSGFSAQNDDNQVFINNRMQQLAQRCLKETTVNIGLFQK